MSLVNTTTSYRSHHSHMCCFLSYAHLEKPNYLPLITFRLVRWSCVYGVSAWSPPAFALYGLLVLGALGQYQRGMEYCDYSLQLMDRLNDNSTYSFTSLIVSVSRSNLQPVTGFTREYMLAYQVGMERGDNYYAIHNLCNHLLTILLTGRPLHEVEKVN